MELEIPASPPPMYKEDSSQPTLILSHQSISSGVQQNTDQPSQQEAFFVDDIHATYLLPQIINSQTNIIATSQQSFIQTTSHMDNQEQFLITLDTGEPHRTSSPKRVCLKMSDDSSVSEKRVRDPELSPAVYKTTSNKLKASNPEQSNLGTAKNNFQIPGASCGQKFYETRGPVAQHSVFIAKNSIGKAKQESAV
ncbi:hypothetical protein SK128_016953 [Halocaridina rubra]|uniref:Uncharacterized protein n=1 Tax=Halocaridina rubra TaxID=373956 RepID=A0AAN8XDP9_HALRR